MTLPGIQELTATVWYAPTKRRRYFRKHSAIRAEAEAIILNKYPVESFESDTGHFYDIRIHESDRYETMHRRLSRLIKRAIQ